MHGGDEVLRRATYHMSLLHARAGWIPLKITHRWGAGSGQE